MDFRDLYKKNIHIQIIGLNKDNLYVFIHLNGLFNFLLKIYESVELLIDSNLDDNIEFNNIFLNFHKDKFKILNSRLNSRHGDMNILFKRIDLTEVYYIEDIYNSVFGIPYSLSFIYKNINRHSEREDEVYNFYLERFNNFPYIFSSLSSNDSIISEKEYMTPLWCGQDNLQSRLCLIYTYGPDSNPYYNFWYLFGRVLENCEELHLNMSDQKWIELSMILDLSKVKRRVIYYSDKDKDKYNILKKRYPKLIDWIFVKI